MATFAGYEGYGGATITRVIDGAGAEWIGCCAKDGAGRFGFYLFKNGVNVPISPFCSGRGTISEDGHWIAWEGNQHFMGELPGFTPIPKSDTSAIELRIATLEATIASLPPTVTGPTIRVPAAGGNEGGEIQLAATDGGGAWSIDVHGGTLRFHRAGKVVDWWPK
jgi:hypothetical protein